ncbi:MAG TPA: VOC family protein [Anaeromyxobacter sp.]|nr:VOC family protein [Anaeromyxobacter sp.]
MAGRHEPLHPPGVVEATGLGCRFSSEAANPALEAFHRPSAPPPDGASTIASCFWSLEPGPPSSGRSARILPDGAVDLILSVRAKSIEAWVMGVATGPRLAQLPSIGYRLGLSFGPGEASAVWEAPAVEYADRVSLGDIMGGSATELVARLSDTGGLSEQVGILVMDTTRLEYKRSRDSTISFVEKLRRKLIGVGARSFFALGRLRYRLSPRRSKLRHLDHVTVPCRDLRVAEVFYVGLLGARVALRLDERLLMRVGWTREQIRRDHAEHVSLTLGVGPRIDIFEYPAGIPGERAVMHTHMAFWVPPGQFLGWQRRLSGRGSAPPDPPGPARRVKPPATSTTLSATTSRSSPSASCGGSSRWAFRTGRTSTTPGPLQSLSITRSLFLRGIALRDLPWA